MMGYVLMHDFSRVALVLISLALGYMVCIRAAELKKGRLKALGYIIGVVIIAGACTMIVTKAVKAARCGPCGGKKQASKHKMMPHHEQALMTPKDVVGAK